MNQEMEAVKKFVISQGSEFCFLTFVGRTVLYLTPSLWLGSVDVNPDGTYREETNGKVTIHKDFASLKDAWK